MSRARNGRLHSIAQLGASGHRPLKGLPSSDRLHGPCPRRAEKDALLASWSRDRRTVSAEMAARRQRCRLRGHRRCNQLFPRWETGILISVRRLLRVQLIRVTRGGRSPVGINEKLLAVVRMRSAHPEERGGQRPTTTASSGERIGACAHHAPTGPAGTPVPRGCGSARWRTSPAHSGAGDRGRTRAWPGGRQWSRSRGGGPAPNR